MFCWIYSLAFRGFLFSSHNSSLPPAARRLYARYRKQPDTFRADYDDFLSSIGRADARTLAACSGMDIHSVDFWRSSLDVIRTQIAEFEHLVE
ncbi:MAG TPA: hypothetical protein VKU00_14660 [Chthonomonadaceae bacterium]|nr:hypothetical protein [Chthonomonadaceae bacterium]